MALGATLRAEREKRGLTERQVAEATHMMVQMVRELEEEDFHRISAEVYGRGFVKLYASFLELDPEPLLKEFVEIYGRAAKQAPKPKARIPLERIEDIAPEEAPPRDVALETAAEKAPSRELGDVEPAKALEGGDAASTQRIHIPAPKSVRDGATAKADDKAGGSDVARDLFGDPLPGPEAEEPVSVLTIPRGQLDSDRASRGDAGVRHSVLGNAAQRFDGRPYKPGLRGIIVARLVMALSVIGGRLAQFFGFLRYLLKKLAASLSILRLKLQPLPWARIGQVSGMALAVILVFWGTVAGFKSCSKRRSEAAAASVVQGGESAVIKRVLPPPAAYADM